MAEQHKPTDHKPTATHPAPAPAATPSPLAADANGAASAADKEWFRRKGHGGTGA
jgi:hypothetical protein